MRRIAEVKSRLQRTNPVEQADRVQPDVRRAGRPRAAPPHSCATWRWAQPREVAPPRAPAGRRWRAGERVLAWAQVDGRRGGSPAPATRSTSPAARLPWEQVEAADWDRDHERLRVSEVGTWGEPRPSTPHPHESAPSTPTASSSWSASGSRRACCSSGTCRSTGTPRRPRGRPARARRALARCTGSTSTTPASTPTTPSSRRPPRPPWPRPAPMSGSTDAPRGAGAPDSRRPSPLANLCGLRTIPCSSTGRAFGC